MCFKGKYINRCLPGVTTICKSGILLTCNNNSVGGGKICRRIVTTLRGTKGAVVRFPKVVRGPACGGILRNAGLMGRGRIS